VHWPYSRVEMLIPRRLMLGYAPSPWVPNRRDFACGGAKSMRWLCFLDVVLDKFEGRAPLTV